MKRLNQYKPLKQNKLKQSGTQTKREFKRVIHDVDTILHNQAKAHTLTFHAQNQKPTDGNTVVLAQGTHAHALNAH